MSIEIESAMTVIQPWATLLALGEKRIETRSWGTKYRGWVAITSSARYPLQCRDYELFEPFKSALAPWVSVHKKLPLGCVVGIGRLAGCYYTGDSDIQPSWLQKLPPKEFAFGNYAPKRYGWLFDEVKVLQKPIPCKGKLYLWPVSPQLCLEINEQI